MLDPKEGINKVKQDERKWDDAFEIMDINSREEDIVCGRESKIVKLESELASAAMIEY